MSFVQTNATNQPCALIECEFSGKHKATHSAGEEVVEAAAAGQLQRTLLIQFHAITRRLDESLRNRDGDGERERADEWET